MLLQLQEQVHLNRERFSESLTYIATAGIWLPCPLIADDGGSSLRNLLTCESASIREQSKVPVICSRIHELISPSRSPQIPIHSYMTSSLEEGLLSSKDRNRLGAKGVGIRSINDSLLVVVCSGAAMI